FGGHGQNYVIRSVVPGRVAMGQFALGCFLASGRGAGAELEATEETSAPSPGWLFASGDGSLARGDLVDLFCRPCQSPESAHRALDFQSAGELEFRDLATAVVRGKLERHFDVLEQHYPALVAFAGVRFGRLLGHEVSPGVLGLRGPGPLG